MINSLLNKSKLIFYLFTSSVILLITLSLIYIISAVELALQMELLLINIPLAVLLSLAIIFYFFRTGKLIFSLIISIVVTILLVYISSKTYDVSWDGQWYHQDAIIKLIEGWNPFYSNYDINKSISESDIWIHHYPHASWIVQANFFKITGSIQSTKFITLLLSYICFCISYTVITLKYNISKISGIIFALCIAFNPITYSQFLSFYVDGQSAMGISIYVILLYYSIKHPSPLFTTLIAFLFIYVINIKFTNLVYLSVFNFAFFVWYFIYNKELRLKLFLSFSVLYIIGVFLIGYSSYTRNTLEKGHPLYPLMGENNVGEIVSNIHASANFFDQNRFENFFSASFAYPEYARNPDSSRFRVPFTKVDYTNYYRTDTELSGFGARWSELMIISFLLLIIVLTNRSDKNRLYLMIFITVLLFSVFINEQCYESRYVTQLWLVPISILIYLYITGKSFYKILSLSVAILFLYNTYMIISTQVKYQKDIRKNINLEIEYLKSINKPIPIKCKYLSVVNRLKENNIPYVILNEETDKQHYQFNHTPEENYYILP